MLNQRIKLILIAFIYFFLGMFRNDLFAKDKTFNDFLGYWLTYIEGSNEKKFILFGVNKGIRYIDISFEKELNRIIDLNNFFCKKRYLLSNL